MPDADAVQTDRALADSLTRGDAERLCCGLGWQRMHMHSRGALPRRQGRRSRECSGRGGFHVV